MPRLWYQVVFVSWVVIGASFVCLLAASWHFRGSDGLINMLIRCNIDDCLFLYLLVSCHRCENLTAPHRGSFRSRGSFKLFKFSNQNSILLRPGLCWRVSGHIIKTLKPAAAFSLNLKQVDIDFIYNITHTKCCWQNMNFSWKQNPWVLWWTSTGLWAAWCRVLSQSGSDTAFMKL